MKIALTAQTLQKYVNSPELPTSSMMGWVVCTARKMMKNWRVIRDPLTRDFRSGVNHSPGEKIQDKF